MSNDTIMLNECVVHENSLYYPYKSEFFTGWKEYKLAAVNNAPMTGWNKSKISYDVFAHICSFFRIAYKEHNSEQLVLLFYSTEKDSWLAWAPPQICNGMTVETDESSPEYRKQRKEMIPADYTLMGTIHHHCSSSAFASGTDTVDEADREGFHLTIGTINKEFSYHARVNDGESVSSTRVKDWVEAPYWLTQTPAEFQNGIWEVLLKNPQIVEVDSVWISNCKKPKMKHSNLQQLTLPSLGSAYSVRMREEEVVIPKILRICKHNDVLKDAFRKMNCKHTLLEVIASYYFHAETASHFYYQEGGLIDIFETIYSNFDGTDFEFIEEMTTQEFFKAFGVHALPLYELQKLL